MLDNKIEYDRMAHAEANLWWYKILHKLCIKEIKQNYKGKDVAIFDAGCGTGGLMQKLISEGYQNVQGIDASSDAIETCKERNLNVSMDIIQNISKIELNHQLDVVICNDVLCYLSESEQLEFLKSVYEKLSDKGMLLINIPALTAFRGTHDIAVGIQERFSKQKVLNLVEGSNFKINSFRYWPFVLSPAIFLFRFFQEISLRIIPIKKIHSDFKFPSLCLTMYKEIKLPTPTEMIMMMSLRLSFIP